MKMIRKTRRTRRATKPSNPTKPTKPSNPTRKKMRGGTNILAPAAPLSPAAPLTKATLIDENNPAAATLSPDTNSKNKPEAVKADTKSTLINENKPSTSLSPETESNATNKETEATRKEPEVKAGESKEANATEAKTGEATEAKTGETEAKTTETEAKTGETIDTEPIVMDVAAGAVSPEAPKKRARTDTELELEPKKTNVAAESEPASAAAAPWDMNTERSNDSSPGPAAENASHGKCSQGASLFDSVPPECIQQKEVALETIIENAVNVPFELAKKEAAGVVLEGFKSSGNGAIAKILMKEALPQLTGPDGKILNAVITDPAVAKEFGEFEKNLSGVIGKSLTQLSHNIEKPLNNAVETAIKGGISTATHAVTIAPGVGAIVAIGEAVGTVNKLKDEAAEIVDAVNVAKLPIDTAMKDIVPLSAAIDEAATKAKNAQDAAASALEVPKVNVPEVPKVNVPVPSAAASGVSNATNDAAQIRARIVADADAQQDMSRNGGSRKRRRIAKLSRRIERTLRRVQNKYGLKDKNSFLRRTLNAKKMK